MSSALFQTKTAQQLPGVPPERYEQMWGELMALGISSTQVAELASYSLAMVVRYALGLSAKDGNVCAIVEDSIEGCVVLATLRHLINGGANGAIISLTAPEKASAEFSQQLQPLSKMGTLLHFSLTELDCVEHDNIISKAHNVMVGITSESKNPLLPALIELLNESSAPIHTVNSPFGVDRSSGKRSSNALFASSTLSLGAPLIGLHEGRDCVGRQYVCDISFTREIYGADLGPIAALFSEQPVAQIFPIPSEASSS